MSTCIICYEKFKLNQQIVACRCSSLVHQSCYNRWSSIHNNEYTLCVHCQGIGVLYSDKYDIYYKLCGRPRVKY